MRGGGASAGGAGGRGFGVGGGESGDGVCAGAAGDWGDAGEFVAGGDSTVAWGIGADGRVLAGVTVGVIVIVLAMAGLDSLLAVVVTVDGMKGRAGGEAAGGVGAGGAGVCGSGDGQGRARGVLPGEFEGIDGGDEEVSPVDEGAKEAVEAAEASGGGKAYEGYRFRLVKIVEPRPIARRPRRRASWGRSRGCRIGDRGVAGAAGSGPVMVVERDGWWRIIGMMWGRLRGR